MNKLTILGSMSGTSLDGLDLVLTSFDDNDTKYNYQIIAGETIPYPASWRKKLANADILSSRELFRLDHDYGKYTGELIKNFLKKIRIKPAAIASHGHTVFHEPESYGSLQIGNGHDIYSVTGIPVVADFRSLDIALGGQGAPLVATGDHYLFNEFKYCLNIGGFSNISFRTEDETRLAYDICPANTILNKVSGFLQLKYDKDGNSGKMGAILPELLRELNSFLPEKPAAPNSLGKEILIEKYFPLFEKKSSAAHNVLATLYEHISFQISKQVNNKQNDKILVTGGGAKNKYLIKKIKEKVRNDIVLPDSVLIDFKEGLIFGFLGFLRLNNRINCFSSVTGAKRNSSTGIIIGVENANNN